MRSVWTWLVTGVVFLFAQAMGGQPQDNDPHATGARRPTAEERSWADRHMVTAGHVRLNKLGLERVNADKRRKGKKELSEVVPAPIGNEVVAAPAPATAPADSGVPCVDNSTLPYFPPIRSQGSIGSCAQFSSMYYTYTHMTAMARGWDAKAGGDQFRFSPKWTYNMVNGGYDNGSYYYDAYAIAQKHGVATWADFPYDGDYRGWCLDPAAWRKAINVRADQTGRVLGVDTDAGLAQLKQLLVNGYVLNFSTYIGSWQFQPIGDDPATAADDAFVGKNCCSWVCGWTTSHSMTVVGYNDDIWVDINGNGAVDAGEKGAFRIANSWGTGWQDGGFTWFAYDALKAVSAVPGGPAVGRQEGWWYGEACWITARASYTPQVVAQFTLNTLRRNQLSLSLGIGGLTDEAPATAWTPNRCLWGLGGSYAFDGTTTACDGTFFLDFTDLASASGAPIDRWFVGMRDSMPDNPGIIRSFDLYQVGDTGDVLVGSAANAPKTADASQEYVWVGLAYTSPNLAPVAAAAANPTTGYEPHLVDLDGSSSRDSDGSIVSYTWDFGNGETASGPNPTVSYIYTTPGAFPVTLTVLDNNGATASTTLTVTVRTPAVNQPPVAVATASPSAGYSPLLVTLDGSSSYDPDGFIGSYAWDFGDGTTAPDADAAVSHSYTTPGIFTVTLTVTDNQGATASTTLTVTVSAPKALKPPTKLVAKLSGRKVTLTWADNSTNETGFYVERGVTVNGQTSFARIATVGRNVKTYTDASAPLGNDAYRVKGFNSATGATSAYSNTASVRVR